ncbi:MAG: ribosome silencing factor [Candidatus Omnitrophica bacterium 4484_70.1]|nr:MAG: ribosome silencing factor [Candidatus Omnitrophica bacterium 4484_70.1]
MSFLFERGGISIVKGPFASQKAAVEIVKFLLSKKAVNPVILDVREVSNLCEYFIICSGETNKHVGALYEGIVEFSQKNNLNVYHEEKDSSLNWIVIDYFDIVLHIFSEEARKFYDLERLWREAKKVKVS